MEHIYDAPFCSEFRCDGDIHFHDYYYISPQPVDEHSLLYHIHRAGIEQRLPKVFEVVRDASSCFVHFFCVLSGSGYLEFDGKLFTIHANQLCFLPAHQAHRYWCDPDDPMGMVWMEICGGDADRIACHLLQQHGPVIEGELFSGICSQICLIQQRLMMDAYYDPSLEVYRLLHTMICSSRITSQWGGSIQPGFARVETYIRAHLSGKIMNAELAHVFGASLQHFLKLFKENYGIAPQEYIMRQRLTMAQHSLLHSEQPIDDIAETLGFYDTSHFIRRFSKKYGMPPVQYRKKFSAEDTK